MDDLKHLEEQVSEVDPNTEENNTKKIIVFLNSGLYGKLLELQQSYRSPSISHTVRLIIEDRWKDMKGGGNV